MEDPLVTSSRQHCVCQFTVQANKNNNRKEPSTIKGQESTLRCSLCVKKVLQPYIERRKRALEKHAAAKEYCTTQLSQIPKNRVPELQAESQRLRDRLTALRKECGDTAVKVAQTALENDTIQEATRMEKSLERRRNNLKRLDSLMEGSMTQAIGYATSQVKCLRLQWALKVLAMYRLDIDPDDIKLTPLQKRRQECHPTQQLQRRARGISKISGLPLPNAGPELYGVLPPVELQSALRLIATVTSTVARCLGIVVPHRILLTLNNNSAKDIIEQVTDEDLQRRRRNFRGIDPIEGERSNKDGSSVSIDSKCKNNISSFSSLDVADNSNCGIITNATSSSQTKGGSSSSTASLLSLVDGSYWTNKAKEAKDAIVGKSIEKIKSSRYSGDNNNESEQRFESPDPNPFISTDATIVAQRIDHATSAILTDIDTSNDISNNNNSSKFALSSKYMNKDSFAIALQLLQNDVIVLCIRAGVQVSKLWPAEAMLLNLHELDKFCQQQTSVNY